MEITVLGTGAVGRTLAGRLDALGHDVVVGTRDVAATLARDTPARDAPAEPDGSYAQWQRHHPGVRLLPLSEAGAHGELVLNATAGAASLLALEGVGAQALQGKVLLDLALPLDLSNGLPPRLLISGDDSLGEQIQRAYPDTRVVKSLHTVFMAVMVEPSRLPGRHQLFVAGDDKDAKDTVTALLGEFGWSREDIIDLGGIQAARATEMYSQLYFQLVGALGTFDLNIAVVRGAQ